MYRNCPSFHLIKISDIGFLRQCSQIRWLYGIKKKAAIASQCKSNGNPIAALFFVLYSSLIWGSSRVTLICMQYFSSLLCCITTFVTRSRGNESLVENLDLYFLTPCTFSNLQNASFDANPITIGYLVSELWMIWQC